MRTRMLALAALALALPVAAQDTGQQGTTVIGEQDAPIGLYIMPWQQSGARGGLDRPARLLDEAVRPIDPEVFDRQMQYNRALAEHAESGREPRR